MPISLADLGLLTFQTRAPGSRTRITAGQDPATQFTVNAQTRAIGFATCQGHVMNLDKLGRSPLHYAALSGDVTEVERLLAEGADPSLADRSGYTPLHFAAQEQRASCVPILVAAGASVDVQDQWGNTPLFRAVFDSRGNGDTINALLAAGADPDVLNHSGVSPRTLAQRVATDEVGRLMS